MLFSNYTIFLFDCKHSFYSSALSLFTYTRQRWVCCPVSCNKNKKIRKFVRFAHPAPAPDRVGFAHESPIGLSFASPPYQKQIGQRNPKKGFLQYLHGNKRVDYAQ
nr:MAG TPA: hypothetical protein [Bacteriophage sp.]